MWEQTGRLEFARNLDDETLDRWFAYDHVGRLAGSHSGNEARLAIGEQVPLLYNGPYSHGYQYDKWGNITIREGWGGENSSFTASYVDNKRVGLTYDAAGNLTNDGGFNFTYDVTGQQATASSAGYPLEQYYDGDGLRVKKKENNAPTYYLRSSVLGGQVVAEINGSAVWQRGYVYLGGELMAVQQGGVYWVHQAPMVKSKRVTNASGTVVSTVELDPWGGYTNRSSNFYFQPHTFSTYERDANGADEAMFRRYNRWWSRFDQPDPYDGSYNLADPQSLNRYAYVQNDPVNLIDPTGLLPNLCLDIWTGDGASTQCFGPYLPWPGFTPKENPVPGEDPEPGSTPTNPEIDGVHLDLCTEDSNGALASLRREATFTLQPGAQQRPGSPPTRPFFSRDFARRLSDAIFEMNQIGIAPQINDGFRTATDQKWYQTHGAGGGRPVNMTISDHQTGNAVDINAVTPVMRTILEKHGLSSLGSDPPHFYIRVNDVATAAAEAEAYYWKSCAVITP